MGQDINWGYFEKSIQDRRIGIDSQWLKNDLIEKAEKDLSKLVKKVITVSRGGRTFKQTVYVKPDTGEVETTPVGKELSPEVGGMGITKYSDKKPKQKRLKVLSSNKMTYDQMNMIQSFNRTEDGNFIGRSEVWKIYGEMVNEKDQKSLDLSLHQEYLDSAYTKGSKTSYGDSGTKDDLLKDYDIKVKRQNGDEINKSEISQIKDAIDSISEVFGTNKEMNKDFGLKISHSGNVMMHARKAVGLFHPFYNAIGVSAASGDSEFKITFAHEYAHFVDYMVGKNSKNTYASDKWGSSANNIAEVFGKNMVKPGKQSQYWNRTCEKFARAFEQYYAVEVLKDDSYFGRDYYLPKDKYNIIKPYIQQFLEENKEILKSINNNIFKSWN